MATYNANKFTRRGVPAPQQAKTQTQLLAEDLAKKQMSAATLPAVPASKRLPVSTGGLPSAGRQETAPPAGGKQEAGVTTPNKDLLEMAQQVAQQEKPAITQRQEVPVTQRQEVPVTQRQEVPVTQRQEKPAITQRQEAPVTGKQETAATSNAALLELAQQAAQAQPAVPPPAAIQPAVPPPAATTEEGLPEWAKEAVEGQQSFAGGLDVEPGFMSGQDLELPGGPMEDPPIGLGTGLPEESPAGLPVEPGFMSGQDLELPGGPMEDPPIGLGKGFPGQPDLQDLTEQAIRDLLTGQGLDTAAEKKARLKQAGVDEAKKIQALRARTGLGGMGLTGAAGALESQVRAEGTRARAITEAELDRAARDEALRRLQLGIGAGQAERGMGIKEKVFGIEMDMYEKEMDQDLNGDGLIGRTPVGGAIGDNDPTNNPDYLAKEEKAKQEALPEVREGKEGRMSQEQVEKALLENEGVRLESLQEGNAADFYKNNGLLLGAMADEVVYRYTAEDGRNVKVRRRDDGTLYLDYEWF